MTVLMCDFVRRADYLNGTMNVDDFVSHHRKFEEINEGFGDMHVRLSTLFPSFSPCF